MKLAPSRTWGRLGDPLSSLLDWARPAWRLGALGPLICLSRKWSLIQMPPKTMESSAWRTERESLAVTPEDKARTSRVETTTWVTPGIHGEGRTFIDVKVHKSCANLTSIDVLPLNWNVLAVNFKSLNFHPSHVRKDILKVSKYIKVSSNLFKSSYTFTNCTKKSLTLLFQTHSNQAN